MNTRRAAAVAALLVAAAARGARAEDYACYVSVDGDKAAIVLVDSGSPEQARDMAARATVRVGRGVGRARVQHVYSCIRRHGEHFADPAAQRLLEQLPL